MRTHVCARAFVCVCAHPHTHANITVVCLSLQELTSPRLIKSHLPYRFLPSDLHNGDSKVTYLHLPSPASSLRILGF